MIERLKHVLVQLAPAIIASEFSAFPTLNLYALLAYISETKIKDRIT